MEAGTGGRQTGDGAPGLPNLRSERGEWSGKDGAGRRKDEGGYLRPQEGEFAFALNDYGVNEAGNESIGRGQKDKRTKSRSPPWRTETA
jgi:hypothetical protein